MDTTVDPLTAFGFIEPFTQNIVEPAPGWIDNTTWRGEFPVSNETGEGIHTIRVSGATDASGFVIPDDTVHQFETVMVGGLAANNGLASAVGTAEMHCTWTELDKPPTALGYNIRRSETAATGSYVKKNTTLLTTPGYTDSGLDSGTVYYYIVDIIDWDYSATQWTPPFYGKTDFATGVEDWYLY